MWSAATVLVCALDILGRGAATFPPITLLSEPPPDVSPLGEAFTVTGDQTIFVLTSSETFRTIQRSTNRCGTVNAVRKLASILVHEEAHVRRGSGEHEAYDAQLATLARLGAGPGTAIYAGVVRAKGAVVAVYGAADLSANAASTDPTVIGCRPGRAFANTSRAKLRPSGVCASAR